MRKPMGLFAHMTTPTNRRTFLQTSIAAVATAFLSGCGSSQQTIINVTGASTLLPVVRKAARVVEERHPEFRFEVSGGGTDEGIKNVASGFGQFAMVARPLTEEERAKFRVFDVATDGVGIVVHATNPVGAITKEQLRGIYTGQIGDWKSVGGGSGAIEPFTKGPGHGTRTAFARYLDLEESQLQGARVDNNAEVFPKIKARPKALAFVSLGEALTAMERGSPVRMLALDGVVASLANVASGSYPARLKLALISRGEPAAGARLLIDFLRSAEGQAITEESHNVPAR